MTYFPGGSLSPGGLMTKFPTQPGIALDFYGNPIASGPASPFYVPGIVTGDNSLPTAIANYNAIVAYQNAFLAAFPNGGVPPAILPPGRIFISQTYVPPTNFFLPGSGNSITESVFNPNGPGSFLCPSAGFTGTQVMRLDNPNTGARDLTLDASSLIASGFQVNAGQCQLMNVSVVRGTGNTLDSTSNTQSFLMVGDWDCRANVQDNAPIAFNAQGADWIVVGGRITHGAKVISVDGGQFLGVHFTHSSASPNNFNVQDQGGSIYSGCYFDSCSPDAVALVQRSGAGGNLGGSLFVGCRYYQNIAGVTVPVFGIVTPENTGGTTVVGGWVKVGSSATGSTFSAFMDHGGNGDDTVVGVSAEQTFGTSFFTNGVPQSAFGNQQNGVPIGCVGPYQGVITPIPFSGGNTYQLAIADQDAFQVSTASVTSTVIVPQQSVVPFPIGTTISFFQTGTGKVVFSQGGATTIVWSGAGGFSNGVTGTRVQNSVVTLTKYGTNTWVLSGDAA